MASIIAPEAGKYAVYRSNNARADSPYSNIVAVTDGGCDIIKDVAGKIWRFAIIPNGSNFDLVYYKSANVLGSGWSVPTVIKASVEEGVPGGVQLVTGRIVVYYWKKVSGTVKHFQSYSDDYGTTWTEVEVTT